MPINGVTNQLAWSPSVKFTTRYSNDRQKEAQSNEENRNKINGYDIGQWSSELLVNVVNTPIVKRFVILAIITNSEMTIS